MVYTYMLTIICLVFSLYLFQDLISALLPRVLPAITVGLQDLDDDVRAVAASALIPVVEGLVQLLPNKVRRYPCLKWFPCLVFVCDEVRHPLPVISHIVLLNWWFYTQFCLSGTLHCEHIMGCSFGPWWPHCFHQQHHDIAVVTTHLSAGPTVQVSLRDVHYKDLQIIMMTDSKGTISCDYIIHLI